MWSTSMCPRHYPYRLGMRQPNNSEHARAGRSAKGEQAVPFCLLALSGIYREMMSGRLNCPDSTNFSWSDPLAKYRPGELTLASETDALCVIVTC